MRAERASPSSLQLYERPISQSTVLGKLGGVAPRADRIGHGMRCMREVPPSEGGF